LRSSAEHGVETSIVTSLWVRMYVYPRDNHELTYLEGLTRVHTFWDSLVPGQTMSVFRSPVRVIIMAEWLQHGDLVDFGIDFLGPVTVTLD
jgi:hypothetical protein